jgi:hypothetical protein
VKKDLLSHNARSVVVLIVLIMVMFCTFILPSLNHRRTQADTRKRFGLVYSQVETKFTINIWRDNETGEQYLLIGDGLTKM